MRNKFYSPIGLFLRAVLIAVLTVPLGPLSQAFAVEEPLDPQVSLNVDAANSGIENLKLPAGIAPETQAFDLPTWPEASDRPEGETFPPEDRQPDATPAPDPAAPQAGNVSPADGPQASDAARPAQTSLKRFRLRDIPDALRRLFGENRAIGQAEKKRFYEVDSVTTYPTEKTPSFPARVKIVGNGREGYLSKVMIIRNARHTVDIGTYIFGRDAVGYSLLHELSKALERGVCVRLSVDSMGSFHFTHSELKALLSAKRGEILDDQGRPTGKRATVEVVIFNSVFNIPIIWEMLRRNVRNWFTKDDHTIGDVIRWRNRRSHDKPLIADRDDPARAIAMTGGRNLDNDYYGIPEITPKTYNDLEIIVRSAPEAAPGTPNLKSTIGAHYDRLFFHLGNKALEPLRSARTTRAQHRKMREAIKAAIDNNPGVRAKLKEMEDGRYLETGFRDSPETDFVNEIENLTRHNAADNPDSATNPLNRPNGDSLVENFRRKVAAGQKSIFLVSPYLNLEARQINILEHLKLWLLRLFGRTSALEDAARRQINEFAALRAWLDADPERTLTIVSNSIMTTDNIPAQALVDSFLAWHFVVKPRQFIERRALMLLKSFLPFGLGDSIQAHDELRPQVKLLSFGRLDSKTLGGTEDYGKLHAKYGIVDGRIPALAKGLVGTSNGDLRSRRLNSESGFIFTGEAVSDLQKEADSYAARSLPVGSPEWEQLRSKYRMKVLLEIILMVYFRVTHYSAWMV